MRHTLALRYGEELGREISLSELIGQDGVNDSR
jgi:hypothetical protein